MAVGSNFYAQKSRCLTPGSGVNIHKKNGNFCGYKKLIGGVRWYFGKDWGIEKASKESERKAEQIADQFTAEFAALRSRHQSWTPATRAAAKTSVRSRLGYLAPEPLTVVQEQPPVVSRPVIPSSPSKSANATGGISIKEAIEQFKEEQRKRKEAKEIGGLWLKGIERRIDSASAGFADINASLESLGREEIKTLVRFFRARPLSKKSQTGERIGGKSVKHRIAILRMFFGWADGVHWEGYRGWEKEFEFSASSELSILSPSEQREIETANPHYSISELSILYSNATPRTRLYMLMGLNCAAGAREIATLRTWNIDIAAKRIERKRHKTGVEAQWLLWDETVMAIRAFCEDINPFVRYKESTEREARKKH